VIADHDRDWGGIRRSSIGPITWGSWSGSRGRWTSPVR
jgi:hypothetical protein